MATRPRHFRKVLACTLGNHLIMARPFGGVVRRFTPRPDVEIVDVVADKPAVLAKARTVASAAHFLDGFRRQSDIMGGLSGIQKGAASLGLRGASDLILHDHSPWAHRVR